ncbi:MAG: hypothetical protein ABI389_13515 [Rhodanobacter sp.]
MARNAGFPSSGMLPSLEPEYPVVDPRSGPSAIGEVKVLHGEVTVLLDAAAAERTTAKMTFPHAAVSVDFTLKAA